MSLTNTWELSYPKDYPKDCWPFPLSKWYLNIIESQGTLTRIYWLKLLFAFLRYCDIALALKRVSVWIFQICREYPFLPTRLDLDLWEWNYSTVSGLLSWKKETWEIVSWSLDMKVTNIIIQRLGNWLYLLLLVLGQKIRDWTSMKYGRSCQNKPSDAT